MANVPASGGTSSSPGSDTSGANTDVTAKTYAFIVSWLVLILVLTAASKTRIGYVLIYYALILIIFGILVTEYKQVSPLFNPVTLGDLNAQTSQQA